MFASNLMQVTRLSRREAVQKTPRVVNVTSQERETLSAPQRVVNAQVTDPFPCRGGPSTVLSLVASCSPT
jgi:hypothetical protein